MPAYHLTWDEPKRQRALLEREVDFAEASAVFETLTFEFEDMRQDYGERRVICYGMLNTRLVVVGYVQRGDVRHIFSMKTQKNKSE